MNGILCYVLYLHAKLLKPRFLQPEYKIKIKIFEDGGVINLCLRLICDAAKWRALQIKAFMYGILRTEQVPHYDKSDLKDHNHGVISVCYISMLQVDKSK